MKDERSYQDKFGREPDGSEPEKFSEWKERKEREKASWHPAVYTFRNWCYFWIMLPLVISSVIGYIRHDTEKRSAAMDYYMKLGEVRGRGLFLTDVADLEGESERRDKAFRSNTSYYSLLEEYHIVNIISNNDFGNTLTPDLETDLAVLISDTIGPLAPADIAYGIAKDAATLASIETKTESVFTLDEALARAMLLYRTSDRSVEALTSFFENLTYEDLEVLSDVKDEQFRLDGGHFQLLKRLDESLGSEKEGLPDFITYIIIMSFSWINACLCGIAMTAYKHK